MLIVPGETTCFMYAGKDTEAQLMKEKEIRDEEVLEPEPEQEISGCIVPVPDEDTSDPAIDLRGRLADLIHGLRGWSAKPWADRFHRRND